ncbi:MAG: ribonuclease Z [Clostridia bacterium]|nr:ribonuclease Z [Clostridia bacterium]
MRITFLGSSHGLPEANRKCSSILLEIAENRYIIDAGTNITEPFATKNLPLSSIRAILITHMHSDHTNGLISFLELCNWAYKDVNPDIFLPGDMEKTKAALEGWMACNSIYPPRAFPYKPVAPGAIYDDGTARFTAFPTKHTAASYAYLLEAEGKRVLFSGDLSHNGPADDFPVSVLEKPLDLAICEAAHFDATDYLPILKGNQNLKRLCFNHYSERHMCSVIEAKNQLSDIPVLIATDGMEIRL